MAFQRRGIGLWRPATASTGPPRQGTHLHHPPTSPGHRPIAPRSPAPTLARTPIKRLGTTSATVHPCAARHRHDRDARRAHPHPRPLYPHNSTFGRARSLLRPITLKRQRRCRPGISLYDATRGRCCPPARQPAGLPARQPPWSAIHRHAHRFHERTTPPATPLRRASSGTPASRCRSCSRRPRTRPRLRDVPLISALPAAGPEARTMPPELSAASDAAPDAGVTDHAPGPATTRPLTRGPRTSGTAHAAVPPGSVRPCRPPATIPVAHRQYGLSFVT